MLLHKKPILLCVNVWMIVILCTVRSPSSEWAHIQTFPPETSRDLHFKRQNVKIEQIFFFNPFSPLQRGEQLVLSFCYFLVYFEKESPTEKQRSSESAFQLYSQPAESGSDAPHGAPKGDRNHITPATFENQYLAKKPGLTYLQPYIRMPWQLGNRAFLNALLLAVRHYPARKFWSDVSQILVRR